ncbi:MAG: hypothetical protein AB4372_35925 [Xenococcus sp. (in: cyanobacteria)]
MENLASIQVMIDLSDADPDLEAEALEELTRNLKQEIEELVEEVNLVRETSIPEGGKPGLANLIPGMLSAVFQVENSKELLNTLGERFYGKTVKLEFSNQDKSYKLEYRSKQQLKDAVEAIEKLSKLR